MINRRQISSSLSARVVQFLRDRGHSQAQVARMLHVSEGFVSLVKSRDRSLTIDHLELISESLSVPLGALLLAATEAQPGSKDVKKLRGLSRQIIEKADVARAAILRGATAAT